MFYHAAGCTISEGAAGDDDGPSKPRTTKRPPDVRSPSSLARVEAFMPFDMLRAPSPLLVAGASQSSRRQALLGQLVDDWA